jgi:hypothetical protein
MARNCDSGKQRHKTRTHAYKHMRKLRDSGTKGANIYKCEQCSFWHVTTTDGHWLKTNKENYHDNNTNAIHSICAS